MWVHLVMIGMSRNGCVNFKRSHGMTEVSYELVREKTSIDGLRTRHVKRENDGINES